MGPKGMHDTKTYWVTVSCKVTSSSTSTKYISLQTHHDESKLRCSDWGNASLFCCKVGMFEVEVGVCWSGESEAAELKQMM
jgi:hypothetical protein